MLEPVISNKADWTRVAFGEVVRLSKERAKDPEAEGYERVVGLEHIDPGDLRIRRWADITDGTTFTSVFNPGQVLFGKRRAYQRKVAVADFAGVCSGDIYVLEPSSDALMPELLPFICQTDAFFGHAVGTSAGSLSPRTNWKSLADFKFLLPPIQEQERLVEALKSFDEASEALIVAKNEAEKVNQAIIEQVLRGPATRIRLEESAVVITKGESPRWQGFEYLSEGIPFITSENVLEAEIDDRSFKCIPEDFHNKLQRSKIYANDVLINIVGASIGRAAVVPETIKEANTNQAVAVVRLDQIKLLPEFLVRIYLSQSFQHQLSRMMVNSARANISLTDIRSFEIPTPSIDEQTAIVARITNIQNQINAISHRCAQLNALREKVLSSMGGDDV